MRLKTDLSKLRKIICFFFFAYMENFKKGVAIFQLNYEIYPQRINWINVTSVSKTTAVWLGPLNNNLIITINKNFGPADNYLFHTTPSKQLLVQRLQ